MHQTHNTHRWSSQDIEWLRTNYPQIGLLASSQHLQRSTPSIRAMASRLGLKQNKNSQFSKEWKSRSKKNNAWRGKKRPAHSEIMKKRVREGRVLINRHVGKHQLSKTKAYIIWNGMMGRCYRTSAGSYMSYGGRGIRVCLDWHNIVKFSEWFNENYIDGYSIERVDVNGHYEPSNCIFIDPKKQAHNTRSNILTRDEVDKIRSLYLQGYTQTEIGKKFSVNKKHIHAIVHNKIWK